MLHSAAQASARRMQPARRTLVAQGRVVFKQAHVRVMHLLSQPRCLGLVYLTSVANMAQGTQNAEFSATAASPTCRPGIMLSPQRKCKTKESDTKHGSHRKLEIKHRAKGRCPNQRRGE